MKICVISNPASPATAFARAKAFGYLTFIYDHADPERTLSANKFLYIHDDDELKEKLTLISNDPTIIDQITRW